MTGNKDPYAFLDDRAPADVLSAKDSGLGLNLPEEPSWNRPLLAVSLVLLLGAGLAQSYVSAYPWPSASEIEAEVKTQPSMTPTTREPFSFSREGEVYGIEPVREYTMAALVTSMSPKKAGWVSMSGIGRRDEKINTFDGTVVWGRNVSEGFFRNFAYYNSGYWGGVRPVYRSGDPRSGRFDPSGFANNHYIPASEEVQAALEKLRPGDQIMVRGALCLYGPPPGKGGGWRGDTNPTPGANDHSCEVVFVEHLTILRSHNAGWRAARAGLLILSGIALSVAVFRRLFRQD